MIDAQLLEIINSNPGNTQIAKHYLDLISDEQYHYDQIKSKYPDTYDFLKSLNDRLMTMAHYQ